QVDGGGDQLGAAGVIGRVHTGELRGQVRQHYVGAAPEQLDHRLGGERIAHVAAEEDDVRRAGRLELRDLDADHATPIAQPLAHHLQPTPRPRADVDAEAPV